MENKQFVPVQIEISEDEEPPLDPSSENETECFQSVGISNPTEKISINPRTQAFRQRFYPNIPDKDWDSWHWQIKNSFTSLSQLSQVIYLSNNEVKPNNVTTDALPVRITPYYASLIDKYNADQAIRKSVVPVFDEFIVSPGEASDPLSEGHDSPVPNLVHRYPDRALFLVTGFCSTYCRYCTRSHMVAKDKCHFGIDSWTEAIDYIRQHSEIRDVLISGGDPLTMPDTHIEYLLSKLRAIEHIQIIRIGTKVPAVLPQRITRQLTSILKKYHPLYLSIHFTHPDEITPEVKQACERLANAGIPLGSQTVLLKGINDNVETMKTLMHKLLSIRVRPYYLYQCDPILGSAHFRTPVSKGLEIIEGLRGHTTGYAIPTYVIDAPGGGGKIPILPDYYKGVEDNKVVLRNYEGKTYYYPDY